jgi:tetratricopeptide (TPR) repeat protein
MRVAILALLALLSATPAVAVGPERPAEAPAGDAPAARPWSDIDQALFRNAAILMQTGDFAAGIEAFQALDRPDSSDVQTWLGFGNRKLKRMWQAQLHYERALALNPANTRAMEYYGEWALEMNDRDKALALLARIEGVCGRGCGEYVDLKAAIETGRFKNY